jgi:hypothetical protein
MTRWLEKHKRRPICGPCVQLGSPAALDNSWPREAKMIRSGCAVAGLFLATLLAPNLDANAAR